MTLYTSEEIKEHAPIPAKEKSLVLEYPGIIIIQVYKYIFHKKQEPQKVTMRCFFSIKFYVHIYHLIQTIWIVAVMDFHVTEIHIPCFFQ